MVGMLFETNRYGDEDEGERVGREETKTVGDQQREYLGR